MKTIRYIVLLLISIITGLLNIDPSNASLNQHVKESAQLHKPIYVVNRGIVCSPLPFCLIDRD